MNGGTVDLGTTYLGLELRSPVVASSSPLTNDDDQLRRLDDAGVGAVVLPSLFEEQLEHDALAIDAMLETNAGVFAEAETFFPELDDYNTGADRYLTHLETTRALVSVPVLASLNGVSVGGWVRYAHLLEQAGADALELNLYQLAADPAVSGADVEQHAIDLVGTVAEAVSIPVAVKVSPFWSSLANLAARFAEAGARGLVLFNRFYQPDLDLDTLVPVPRLALSTSDELRLPLRWIALLRDQVPLSLGATSGVHTWQDAAKVLLAGADVAMMASALLQHGPGRVAEVLDGLRAWMAERGYSSVRQLVGSASFHTGPDPMAFERANYVSTLASWSSRPR
jgi:dihydroorotate dehydrogenase (fumarate)